MDETEPGSGTVLQKAIPLNADGFWQYAQPIRYDNYVLSASGGASAPGVAVNPTTDNQYVFFRGGNSDITRTTTTRRGNLGREGHVHSP